MSKHAWDRRTRGFGGHQPTRGSVRASFVLASAMSLAACKGGARSSSGSEVTAAEVAAAEVASSDAERAPAPVRATSAEADTAAGELAALDGRRPVPLLPMMAWHQKQSMMQHLVVIQQIVAAAAKEDWKGVADVAKGLEASAGERQICEHMGAGAEGFTELALDFHDRASAIRNAAEARDGAGVLEATASTLQACTSCHAAYRQDVVDEQRWQQRTGGHVPMHGSPAPTHGGHESAPGGH